MREAADQVGMPQQQADHSDIELLFHWGRHRRAERSQPDKALPAHVADERVRQWLERERAEGAAAEGAAAEGAAPEGAAAERAAAEGAAAEGAAAGQPPAEPQITFVPVEAHLTQRATFAQDARERKADRIESALQQRFTDHLRQLGHEPSGVNILVGQRPIKVDLFDRTTGTLYEAKASPEREKIRMAIGQLFDYRRSFPERPQLRVLVPERPEDDLCQLLADVGIGVAWPEGDGWQEIEPDHLGTVDLR